MQLKQALCSQQFGQHSSALVREPKWFWVQILTWGPFYVHPIPQTMNLNISLCGELGGDPYSLSWTANLCIPVAHVLSVWFVSKPNMMLISNKGHLTENVQM